MMPLSGGVSCNVRRSECVIELLTRGTIPEPVELNVKLLSNERVNPDVKLTSFLISVARSRITILPVTWLPQVSYLDITPQDCQ
jgi:hypothetical protein